MAAGARYAAVLILLGFNGCSRSVRPSIQWRGQLPLELRLLRPWFRDRGTLTTSCVQSRNLGFSLGWTHAGSEPTCGKLGMSAWTYEDAITKGKARQARRAIRELMRQSRETVLNLRTVYKPASP